MGGKNFENYCACVLEKYFSMIGQFVIFCDIFYIFHYAFSSKFFLSKGTVRLP